MLPGAVTVSKIIRRLYGPAVQKPRDRPGGMATNDVYHALSSLGSSMTQPAVT